MVPLIAVGWYRYQTSATHAAKGFHEEVLQDTLSQRDWMVLFASSIMAQCLTVLM